MHHLERHVEDLMLENDEWISLFSFPIGFEIKPYYLIFILIRERLLYLKTLFVLALEFQEEMESKH